LKLLAKSMSKKLTILDLHNQEAGLVKTLKSLEVNTLVAGDIFVEQHVAYLQKVCNKAGVNLLEPLFGRKTLDLFHEIFESGFKATIIGVNNNYLGEELLGFTLGVETVNTFLSKIEDACRSTR
jgi:diphthine-ammonia ligase